MIWANSVSSSSDHAAKGGLAGQFAMIRLTPEPGLVQSSCGVEQRLARQAHNLEVVGSIPAGVTFLHKAPFEGLFLLVQFLVDRSARIRGRICPDARRVV